MLKKALLAMAPWLPKDNDRKVELFQVLYVVVVLLSCAMMARPWRWIFLGLGVLGGRIVISMTARWIHRNYVRPVNEVEARFAQARKVGDASMPPAAPPVIELPNERRR